MFQETFQMKIKNEKLYKITNTKFIQDSAIIQVLKMQEDQQEIFYLDVDQWDLMKLICIYQNDIIDDQRQFDLYFFSLTDKLKQKLIELSDTLQLIRFKQMFYQYMANYITDQDNLDYDVDDDSIKMFKNDFSEIYNKNFKFKNNS